MATSGSTNYSRTALQMITFAHKLLQLIPSGGTVGANELADGLESAELMLKSWSAEGIKLWTQTEARLFLVDGTASYSMPGARACRISELAETTLDAAEASGQTVLSVTSTSGFTNSDVIGVMLDDETIHWTTISSFATDDTVTIASALTGAAASGNAVYVYTNALERPLEVISARLLLDGIETPMTEMARDEYFTQPDKATAGYPTSFYYDPQLTTGKFYVWQPADSAEKQINLTYRRIIEDIDSTANDLDFPQEWLECFGYNLAVRIAPQYGKVLPPEIVAIAGQLKDLLEDWSQEPTDVQFHA